MDSSKKYLSKLSENLPVLALENTVLFPGANILVRVVRESGLQVLEKAKETDGYFIAITKKSNHDSEVPQKEDLYSVGTLGKLSLVNYMVSPEPVIKVEGLERIRLANVEITDSLITAQGQVDEYEVDMDGETIQALRANIQEVAGDILEILDTDTDLAQHLQKLEDTQLLIYLCSQNLTIPVDKKQELYSKISRTKTTGTHGRAQRKSEVAKDHDRANFSKSGQGPERKYSPGTTARHPRRIV